MSSLLLRLAFRNVLRNRRRSLFTLTAISLGVVSAIGLASLARGVSEQFTTNAIYNLTGHIQLHAKGFLDDPSVDYRFGPPAAPMIDRLSSAGSWAPRLRVPAVVASERESAGVTLVGISPAQESKISFLASAHVEGTMLDGEDADGIIIGRKLAEKLRTQLGRRVVLMSQHVDGKIADRGFRIVGIFDAPLESTETSIVFISLRKAQALLGFGDSISEIALLTSSRHGLAPVVTDLREHAPALDTRSWEELEPMVLALTNMQDGMLRVWFFIVVVAVGFGLVNTLFMSIFERVRELGLMQSLGMRPAAVTTQIVFESALILVAGILIGNVFALCGLHFFREGIDLSRFAAGAARAGLSSVIYPTLKTKDFLTANGMIFVLSLLGSFYPARRASRYDAATAMRKT